MGDPKNNELQAQNSRASSKLLPCISLYLKKMAWGIGQRKCVEEIKEFRIKVVSDKSTSANQITFFPCQRILFQQS